MVKGKGKARTAGKRTARSEVSRFEVLLENIQEQNRATIEAVFGVERRLTEKIDSVERRLTLRIEALEIAVRKNSEDIRKNSEDIEELRLRLDGIALELRAKPGPEELKRLEERIARIETHLGLGPAS